MFEIVISVAAKVAEYLVDPIIRPLDYLFNYRRNITDLNQQIHSLDLERERLQISVNEALRQGDEIFRSVQGWLTYAEGIIQKRDDFNEDEKKASKSCFYLKSRYQLSKQAKKQVAEIVDKIQEAPNFGVTVSYRLPPPPFPFIRSSTFIDYEAFQSRESTFHQIMEALRNDDMSMIGVWGMGGVGKTTLVKRVAQQAEEDKLFHKVVMALNISPTPNIAEIQEKIARMLGLKFEAEDDRAGRLRQRLKREEKILVILDDIWEKLELGKIGIPYADDHKGCKVLLTSRERQVLSKDMRTQEEFHLQHLSEDEAWNLFKKTAGDSVESLELRPIAVDVVKNCAGLPVAIVTIANALRGERVGVWENALEELRSSAPTNIRGVSKNVYSCLELSYNHLDGDEVKSLFLLCGLLGDGDIFMDHLLQHAIGLNLFEGLNSWEKAANKLTTLVENLKASSLLLEGEDKGNHRRTTSLFFDRDDQNIFVRMHDVVRDAARAIASKDPLRFVVKEAVGLQEEWQWMDECRNCTRISLICRNIDELPQGLLCPKLEFFLLDSSNDDDDSYLEIPDAFLQDTKQLRVLDLYKVSLAPSPSSLGFLSNLRTLCLNRCVLQDIAVIGDLKRLQVLSLAESHIEQLPKEMMQLSDLRVLDLWNCKYLEVIPRNVISSLSRLEYLSMEGCSNFEWEKEGFNSGERINNACVSELKHLSGLRTLAVRVSDPSLLPEDDLLFANLNLTRYSILIGDPIWMPNDEYKASRRLMLNGVKSLHMVNCFSKLLKKSQLVLLSSLNDIKDVVYELDKEGFAELKYLIISYCPTIRCILHSTSAEWVPPCNTFCMLEELSLTHLSNLEAVCHGPILMGSFGNLRILDLRRCERLKYVFSLPTQHGRESTFAQLQSLKLEDLPEVISFYSTRSSGSEESVTFFNQQIAFPSLEDLDISNLDSVEKIWNNEFVADSFGKLKRVSVQSCQNLWNVVPFNMLKRLPSLQILKIVDCNSLEEVFDLESIDSKESHDLRTLQLRELCLDNLEKLKYVWNKDPQGLLTYQNLRSVQVSHCPSLKIPYPGYVVRSLLQVKEVDMNSCGVEEIVAHEDVAKVVTMFLFPEVTSLTNSCLEQLECFYLGLHNLEWPMLKTLEVESHESLEKLASKLDKPVEQPIFLCEKVAFPNLEYLNLSLKLKEIQHLHLLFGAFSNLRILIIENCPFLSSVLSSNFVQSLSNLKKLTVKKCDLLEEVFDLNGLDHADSEHVEMLSKLEELSLIDLPMLKYICNNSPLQVSCFQNLKLVRVKQCDSFMYLFSASMALGVVQLQELYIEHCSTMKEIVMEDSDTDFRPRQVSCFQNLKFVQVKQCESLMYLFSASIASGLVHLKHLCIENCSIIEEIVTAENRVTDKITFPHITQLSLLSLPNLTSFYLRTQNLGVLFNEEVAFPKLEFLYVNGLDNVKKIWHNQLLANSFSKLKEMKVENCDELQNILTSKNRLPSLESLTIDGCGKLKEVFDLEVINVREHVTDSRLSQLGLDDLQNLEHICNKVLGKNLFLQNLKFLKVHNCGSLKKLFSPYTELEGIKEIVRQEEGAEEIIDKIEFPELRSLSLESLPSLVSFYPGSHTLRRGLGLGDHYIFTPVLFSEKVSFPNLEILKLSGLPKLKEIWDYQLPFGSFCNLHIVEVEECSFLLNIVRNNLIASLQNLEKLNVEKCDQLQEVFDIEGLDHADYEHVGMLSKLEELKLIDLPKLRHICNKDLQQISCFQNLKLLHVKQCGSLTHLFSSGMALGLVQLKDLCVEHCSMIKDIIMVEDRVAENIIFPQTTQLSLISLPNLTSFYMETRTHEKVHMGNCDILACLLFHEKVSFPNLEILKLSGLSKLTGIWDRQLPLSSFCNLHILEVEMCPFLLNVVPNNLIASLKNLEKLNVGKCDQLKEVFDLEGLDHADYEHARMLPKLEELKLIDLPQLGHICNKELRQISFFHNLRVLQLKQCDSLKYLLSASMALGLVQLNDLWVEHCSKIKEIIKVEDRVADKIIFPRTTQLSLLSLPKLTSFYLATQTRGMLFNEEVAFPRLANLDISNLDSVEKIWHNEFAADSFGKLKRLSVRSCQKLRNVIPSNMLKRLPSLQILKIVDSNSLEEIFDLKSIDSKESQDIPTLQLQELALDNLEKLKYVWNNDPQGLLTYQNLKSVQVSHCPSLEIPFPSYVVKSLLQVKEVDINSCGVEEIVAHEGVAKVVAMFLFPEVTSMTNSCLKQLECFYLGLHNLEWPMLKTLEVESYESLEQLASNLDKPVEQPIFLCEKVTFPNLEILNLSLKLEEIQDLHVLFGALSNLKILIVENSPFLLSLFSLQFIQCLNNLKKLTVKKCDQLEEVFDLKGLDHGDVEHAEMLSKLEEVSLIDLPELRYICNNSPPQVLCFQNLKSLQVKQCNSVTYLFSPSMALDLMQLQDLCIEDCPKMKEIVTTEDTYFDNQPRQVSCFQNLKSVRMKQCDSLMYLFSSSFALALVQLQYLRIEHCNTMNEIVREDREMDSRHPQVSCFKNLKSVQVKQCDSLMYLFSSSFALALAQLQDLCIEHCSNMKEIVNRDMDNRHPQVSCFKNLKSVQVKQCDSLMYLFSSSFALALAQLQDLRIEHCNKMEEIVREDRDMDNRHPKVSCFKNLKFVQVKHCNSLMYLFSSSFALAPVQLQDLCIEHCSTMKEIVREDEDMDNSYPQVLCFKNLKFVQVKQCDNLMYLFSSSFALGLVQLQDLCIEHCYTMKEIVIAKGVTDEIIFPQITRVSLLKLPKLTSFYLSQTLKKIHMGDSNMAPGALFNEKVAFPNLEFLNVSGLDDVKKIWHNQLFANAFSKLKEMKVENCNELQNISAFNVLKWLPSLEFLRIASCGKFQEVFDLDVTNVQEDVTDNRLSQLVLDDLQNLEHICHKVLGKKLCLQNLKFLEVHNCGSMKKLFSPYTELEGVKEIIGQEEGAEEVIDKIEFPELTSLSLESLPSLASFYPGSHTVRRGGPGDHDILITVLFNEKVAFPILESLDISSLGNMKKIWHNKLIENSFSKLNQVKVENCNELQNVLPSNVLKWLPSLHFLRIAGCDQLKEVFDLEGAGDILEDVTATELNHLVLQDLPQLQHIWNKDPYGILTFHNLDLVEVLGFHGLKSHFPASSLVRDLSQLEKQLIRSRQPDFGNNEGKDFVFPKVIIRSRWTEDLGEKDEGEDFVFPEVTDDKLLDVRKIKGKEVLKVHDYVSEISEDIPGSSG